ncbi:hypothetical protein MTO96_039970 [Rhipicephalus appendiculatus]
MIARGAFFLPSVSKKVGGWRCLAALHAPELSASALIHDSRGPLSVLFSLPFFRLILSAAQCCTFTAEGEEMLNGQERRGSLEGGNRDVIGVAVTP